MIFQILLIYLGMIITVIMTDKKFKDRYVLGVGYPKLSIFGPATEKCIYMYKSKNLYDDGAEVEIKWPEELRGFHQKKYRLILERVDE